MTYREIVWLNAQPLAYQVLIRNPEYIHWKTLEYNNHNYPIYSYYPEYITWTALINNPLIEKLVVRDIDQINWKPDNLIKKTYYSLNIN
jgi:hypothetical protein